MYIYVTLGAKLVIFPVEEPLYSIEERYQVFSIMAIFNNKYSLCVNRQRGKYISFLNIQPILYLAVVVFVDSRYFFCSFIFLRCQRSVKGPWISLYLMSMSNALPFFFLEGREVRAFE